MDEIERITRRLANIVRADLQMEMPDGAVPFLSIRASDAHADVWTAELETNDLEVSITVARQTK